VTDSPLGRIVEIAENGRHIGKDRGFLTVSTLGSEIGRVALDDLAAVITTARSPTTSQEPSSRTVGGVLTGLLEIDRAANPF
jgi:hypothetical protein